MHSTKIILALHFVQRKYKIYSKLNVRIIFPVINSFKCVTVQVFCKFNNSMSDGQCSSICLPFGCKCVFFLNFQINSIYFLFEFCWNYFNVKRYANDKFSSDRCFDVSCEIMSKNSQYSKKCSWAYSELINQWTTVWEKQTAQTSAYSKHNLIFWSILCTNPLNEHTL